MNGFRVSALAAITLTLTLNGCALGGGDPETSTDATDGTDSTNATDGTEAPAGLSCWDLNGNGVFDPATEDTDRNGYPTAEDCRGEDGQDGKSCTVAASPQGGAVVTCSDGIQVTVKNGTDGKAGATGAAGLNGTGCTAVDTKGGVLVKCQDGTEAVLNDGTDGQNGADGTSCVSEPSGTYKGCIQVVCGELKSEPICDGKDGEPGQDGTGVSQCQSDSDCLNQQLCVDGDLVAVLHSYCWEGQCLPANLELGTFCDYGCSKGSCLPECNNSAECAPGYVCTDGSCQVDTVPQPECSSNSDCYQPPSCSGNILGTPTYACQAGQCVFTGGGSTTCQYGCSQGQCNAAPSCNDGIPCTVDSVSTNGGCQHVANDALCQDGDICTTNSCVLGSGCAVSLNTLSCDDGLVCTVGESCSGGECRGGQAKNCDDGNSNTIDSCDPVTGCKHEVVSTPSPTCRTLTAKSGWLIDGSVGTKSSNGLPSGNWGKDFKTFTWCPGNGQIALLNGHQFPNVGGKDWVVGNPQAPNACTSTEIAVNPAIAFEGPLPAELGCVPHCDVYGNTNYLCQ